MSMSNREAYEAIVMYVEAVHDNLIFAGDREHYILSDGFMFSRGPDTVVEGRNMLSLYDPVSKEDPLQGGNSIGLAWLNDAGEVVLADGVVPKKFQTIGLAYRDALEDLVVAAFKNEMPAVTAP